MIQLIPTTARLNQLHQNHRKFALSCQKAANRCIPWCCWAQCDRARSILILAARAWHRALAIKLARPLTRVNLWTRHVARKRLERRWRRLCWENCSAGKELRTKNNTFTLHCVCVRLILLHWDNFSTMLLDTIDNHTVTKLRELFPNNKRKLITFYSRQMSISRPLKHIFCIDISFFFIILTHVHIDVVALRIKKLNLK